MTANEDEVVVVFDGKEVVVKYDRQEFLKFLLERLGREKAGKLHTYLGHILADEDGPNSAQFKAGLAKWLHETTGKVADGSEWLFSEPVTPADMPQELTHSAREFAPGEAVYLDESVIDGLGRVLYDFIALHHPETLTSLFQHPAANEIIAEGDGSDTNAEKGTYDDRDDDTE
jgi:hypothetical protein